MASAASAPNRCSICGKSGGTCICNGCKNYFCAKDFNVHRQQLSIKFDDIVSTHDELSEQMKKSNIPNASRSELFNDIDRWENATTEKVHQAAERARQQLAQLLNQEQERMTNEFATVTKEIRNRRDEEDFDENDIERLRQEMNQIQISLEQFIEPTKNNAITVTNDGIDWNHFIYVSNKQCRIAPSLHASLISIPPNAQWQKNGITVAGGNGLGNGSSQLNNPIGLCVDDEQTIYVADLGNHRIMEWKLGATNGQVVAGGKGQGNGVHQLNRPLDVILDKESDSLIIADNENKRVVRWPRRNSTSGKIIVSNINCVGLAMDESGSLYVVDITNHEVRRYRREESHGTVVAGGNGRGDRLDQLSSPQFVFVDCDRSVYVSDMQNHRVMKWEEGAKHGVVVAGAQGEGNTLKQLYVPIGVFVDQLGTVYVADQGNHRIMRWPKGATEGSIIVGDNRRGEDSNQFNNPIGLSLDRHGNLYVVDHKNHRVQRFSILK